MADMLVINLSEPWAECWACGAEAPYRWSLPIGRCAELVPNDYDGDWCGVPACQHCYEAHAQGLLTADNLTYWRRRAELARRALTHLIVRD